MKLLEQWPRCRGCGVTVNEYTGNMEIDYKDKEGKIIETRSFCLACASVLYFPGQFDLEDLL